VTSDEIKAKLTGLSYSADQAVFWEIAYQLALLNEKIELRNRADGVALEAQTRK
jgi:hypothetical protein